MFRKSFPDQLQAARGESAAAQKAGNTLAAQAASQRAFAILIEQTATRIDPVVRKGLTALVASYGIGRCSVTRVGERPRWHLTVEQFDLKTIEVEIVTSLDNYRAVISLEINSIENRPREDEDNLNLGAYLAKHTGLRVTTYVDNKSHVIDPPGPARWESPWVWIVCVAIIALIGTVWERRWPLNEGYTVLAIVGILTIAMFLYTLIRPITRYN